MQRGHRCFIAFLAWLLSFTACAHQGELTAADRTAIRTVIERQIEAFRQDDAVSAFAFASPEIRAKYGTPDMFMAAVKIFYAPVYRPRRTGGFVNLYVMDGQLTQPVLLVGPHGEFVVALYAMQRQPDGDWKILGCSLIP
jgi:hypothetical protein